jgi:hypothetical protein
MSITRRVKSSQPYHITDRNKQMHSRYAPDRNGMQETKISNDLETLDGQIFSAFFDS